MLIEKDYTNAKVLNERSQCVWSVSNWYYQLDVKSTLLTKHCSKKPKQKDYHNL